MYHWALGRSEKFHFKQFKNQGGSLPYNSVAGLRFKREEIRRWSFNDSGAEQTWTEDHLMKNPPSIHLSYLWVDKCRWKEINRTFFGRNELLYAYKHCSCERSQRMDKEAFVSPFSSISTIFTLHSWNFRWYLLVIWCTLLTDFWYLSMNNHSFVCIMYSHVLRRNTQHWTCIISAVLPQTKVTCRWWISLTCFQHWAPFGLGVVIPALVQVFLHHQILFKKIFFISTYEWSL